MTLRRRRVRSRVPNPRRRDAPRWTWEEWQDATLVLQQRCQGRCEHCGLPLEGRLERHHRQRRRDGGDRFANVLALLPRCHAWITEHPAAAVEHGWIVRTGFNPATVPVRMGESGLWLLDDSGSRRPAP